MTSYHIPEPCHEHWDAMSLTERGRHCAVCAKEVVDLTGRSAPEARSLLERKRASDGAVCARVRVDRRKRLVLGRFRRHVLTNGLAMLLASGAAMTLSGCEIHQPVAMGESVQVDPDPVPAPQPDPNHEIMGDIAVVEMGEIVPDPAPQPVDDGGDDGGHPLPQPPEPVMGLIAPTSVVVDPDRELAPAMELGVVQGRIASQPPTSE